MQEILKSIRRIIGKDQKITFTIYDDEIWFDIYEAEIPIIVKLKDKEVFVDCEAISNRLDKSMLEELMLVCKVIDEDMDCLMDLVE